MPDYYGEAGSDSPMPEKPEMAKKPESDDEKSTQEGFLIPKSALMGAEIEAGETYEFVAVHDYGDEVEFRYKRMDEPEGKPKTSMAEAEGKLDQMATTNMSQEEA